MRDELDALRKIAELLGTAIGAGVYDIGPPAPGTEGTRSRSRDGYALAVYEIAQNAIAKAEGRDVPV